MLHSLSVFICPMLPGLLALENMSKLQALLLFNLNVTSLVFSLAHSFESVDVDLIKSKATGLMVAIPCRERRC